VPDRLAAHRACRDGSFLMNPAGRESRDEARTHDCARSAAEQLNMTGVLREQHMVLRVNPRAVPLVSATVTQES